MMTPETTLAPDSPAGRATVQLSQPTARLPYLPGLDGLRAIAVIAVVLYHADTNIRGGFLGVESFFVVSGFLITALLMAEWREQGKVSLRGFWLRRARRLLPALILVLLGTLFYTILFRPRETAEIRDAALAALAFVMNWFLVFSRQSYFDPSVRPPLLQHLWSLAVEEQFYLFWPLLFSIGMRYARATGLFLLTLAAAAASIALMTLLYQPGADPSRIYYGTDTRAAGLLLGAALAMVWTPGSPPTATSRTAGRVLDLIGVLALGGLAASYLWLVATHPLLYRGGFFLVALCTAVVIMAVTHPGTRLAPAVLGWSPLRWIGLRSYGIYLWHWPVFLLTRPYLDVPLQGWPLLLLRLAIVGVLVELSYRYVEMPVRHGAVERAWQALWERRTTIFMNLCGSGLRRLHYPIIGILALAGLMWATQVDAPQAAAPVTPPQQAAAGVAVAGSDKATATPAANETPDLAVAAPLAASATATAAATKPGDQSSLLVTSVPPVSPTVRAPVDPASGLPRSPSPTPAPPAISPVDPALAEQLQGLLEATLADGFIPGAELSVSIPGYEPWNGVLGVADRARNVPMEPDTLIHIASVTKMWTAVVVLQLAEEGKIDLDAPISTWLPDLIQFSQSTTPRHLLSHTSGIYDYLEDSRFFVRAYQNPEQTWTPEQLVGMANQVGAAFRPGTEGAWKYSSTNFVVLGMLVEQVTGRTLAEEMRERIFDPLELRHTFFAPQEQPDSTVAQGYVGGSDRVDVSMSFVFGTGNLISTAADLRQFAAALFNGRLLKPESLALMTTTIDTGGAYEMPELEYGLGVMRARLNVGPGPDGAARPEQRSEVLGHIGGIAGFRTAVWWVPESGITIALSLNQADLDPNILARDTLETILTWQGR